MQVLSDDSLTSSVAVPSYSSTNSAATNDIACGNVAEDIDEGLLVAFQLQLSAMKKWSGQGRDPIMNLMIMNFVNEFFVLLQHDAIHSAVLIIVNLFVLSVHHICGLCLHDLIYNKNVFNVQLSHDTSCLMSYFIRMLQHRNLEFLHSESKKLGHFLRPITLEILNRSSPNLA